MKCFFNDKLLCGIQIKPTSYNISDADYILRAKQTNVLKNELYEKTFNVPVVTITSEISGNITSHDTLQKLHSFHNKM